MKNAPWAAAREKEHKKFGADNKNFMEEMVEEKHESETRSRKSSRPTTMTVGCGHFWTVEAAFKRVKGVTSI
jgi:hypothetical protein